MILLKRIFLRILILTLWIGIIFSVLYISKYWPFNLTKKSINVFAWHGTLDSNFIQKFEQKTGIKVNLSYYESNEELLVKLSATKAVGYDLIVPGDYTVDILRKQGILKKIDKTKLNFWDKLNPLLLNKYYDKNNDYSIPAEWSIFGIGLDEKYFKDKNIPIEHSWKLVFEPSYAKTKVIMSNDPLVTIPIAAIYLYGSLNDLTVEKLENIKNLLVNQKKFVLAYSDFRPEYYIATKNSPIALGASSYISKSVNSFDNISFFIPKEGTIITIESYAIPITTNKDDLVYEFLNFIFEPETVAFHFHEYGLFPTTIDVFDKLETDSKIKDLLMNLTQKDFEKFNFIRLDLLKKYITEQYLQDLWIRIKS